MPRRERSFVLNGKKIRLQTNEPNLGMPNNDCGGEYIPATALEQVFYAASLLGSDPEALDRDSPGFEPTTRHVEYVVCVVPDGVVLAQDHGAMAQLRRQGEVVRGGHGGDGAVLQEVHQPARGAGIEGGRRLIQEQDPRLEHQQRGEGHALLLATAEVGGRAVPEMGDAGLLSGTDP